MGTDASLLLWLQISQTLTLSCPIRHLQRPPHDLQLLPGQIHRKAHTVPMSPSVPWQVLLCSPPVWGSSFSISKPISVEVVLPFPACSAVSTVPVPCLNPARLCSRETRQLNREPVAEVTVADAWGPGEWTGH